MPSNELWKELADELKSFRVAVGAVRNPPADPYPELVDYDPLDWLAGSLIRIEPGIERAVRIRYGIEMRGRLHDDIFSLNPTTFFENFEILESLGIVQKSAAWAALIDMRNYIAHDTRGLPALDVVVPQAMAGLDEMDQIMSRLCTPPESDS